MGPGEGVARLGRTRGEFSVLVGKLYYKNHLDSLDVM